MKTLASGSARNFLAIAIAAALTVCGVVAYAQSGAGSIQGTVTDPTGAVIPGAAIRVLNQATGVAVDTRSNAVGFYQVPDLFTGNYTVTITAPGMKTTTQTLELLVAQSAEVNVTMTAGAVSQQVTVAANTVQLETTDNGTITATLENARINELPMNGRDIASLVSESTPGLENCPESADPVCANGQSGPATEFEVDGATLANREFGGDHQGNSQFVDPDAVQEVRVIDENGSAQYASPTTAVLSTKSGTNSLHGSAFETARNNGFGIANDRSDTAGTRAPEYIRNEFGASVGGPIVIPHIYHGKDRTFFFFAYERYSLAQHDVEDLPVPTQAMRNGDFSQVENSSNVPLTLYDPATTGVANTGACPEPPGNGAASPANAFCRQPFPGNATLGTTSNFINPATTGGGTHQSPLSATFNAMMPLPTNTNNPTSAHPDNFVTSMPELTTEPQITFRLDQVFNENNRAYLRYTQNQTNDLFPRNDPDQTYTLAATAPGGAAIPYEASGAAIDLSNVFATALGFTHTFSPTFYSESVLSMSWYGEQNLAAGHPFANYESEFGLPNNFGELGFPLVEGDASVSAGAAMDQDAVFQPFDGTQFLYGVTSTTYIADENLTKIVGKHQLMFGGRYKFEHFGSRPDEDKDELQFGDSSDYVTGLLNPSTYTASAASAYSDSGHSVADEFIGGAYNYSANLQPPYQHLHDMEFDAYLQDNWRFRNNLTFNLGLRWEAHPAAYESEGEMAGFDLKNDAMVMSGTVAQLESEGLTTASAIANDYLDDAKTIETPAEAGLPPMLVNNYDLTFSPRVGAAWLPFGKWGTILRGGVGRYIYPVPIREGYREVGRQNPLAIGYSENYTSSQYTPHNGYQMLAPQNSSSTYTNSTVTPSTTFGPASSASGAYVASPGTPIAGLNSSTVVNSSTTTAITPGLTIINIDPDYPPDYTDEADFTIEQPMKWNSVLRVSYVYTHGTNLGDYFFYDDHPSTFSWEIQEATTTPSSSAVGATNTNTGEGPYDNLTYGDGSYQIQKSGWSNYHALQANYQKLYHTGSAWQVQYVWSKSMRAGGDYGGESADEIDPYINYMNSYVGSYTSAGPNNVSWAPADGSNQPVTPNLPPPPPAGTQPWQYYRALNRWENYMEDTNNPPQHVQFNGLLDLPFGRGKRYLGSVNKGLNELVGGWQLAGAGRFIVTDFAVTTTMYGPENPLVKYKKSVPITDCRSGNCLKSYEWFNGYIPPTNLSSSYTVAGQAGCAGTSTKTITGLPTGWQPYAAPMDVICTANGSTPTTDKYFGDNEVEMSGGSGIAGSFVGYGIIPANNSNGNSESAIDVTNPYGHTVMNGPMNWTADASLFKVFPIRESMNLRINLDAFNVFNNQGLPNPSGTDGTVCVTPGGLGCSSNSLNATSGYARQLQITARFNF
jgi:Carboxypeptidase regulatory-like domain